MNSQAITATNTNMPAGVEDAYVADSGLYVIGQTDYNNLLQLLGKDPVNLGTDGYLLTCDAGDIVSGFYDQVCSLDTPLTVDGRALHPVQDSCVTGAAAVLQVSADGTGIGALVVPDDVVAGMPRTLLATTPRSAASSSILRVSYGSGVPPRRPKASQDVPYEHARIGHQKVHASLTAGHAAVSGLPSLVKPTIG